MEITLIEEGLKFLVLGMTTVYLFLYLMVVILKIEAKIVHKYFPTKKIKSPSPVKQKASSGDSSEDEVVAAIVAAIKEHTKK